MPASPRSSDRSPRWPPWVDAGLVGQVTLLLLGILLVLGPLCLIVLSPPPAMGRPSPVSPWSALHDPHLRSLLMRSLRLAGWVTAAALLVGLPLGLWLSGQRGPKGLAVAGLHLLPLCLPPYVTGLGWTRVLGREGLVASVLGDAAGRWCSRALYGELGVVLVLGVALAPVVTLLTAAFLRGIDPSRVEAARLQRGRWMTSLRIELPLALPGILAGALLVFVLAAGEVAVPQLLRVPVYATVVFARLADLSFQPGEALALAVPTTALAVGIAVGLQALDRQGRRARGLRHVGDREVSQPSRAAGFAEGFAPGRLLSAAAAIGFVLLTSLPVLLLLLDAARERGGGWSAMAAAWPALGNSLRYALISACVMTALAVILGPLWSRRPRSSSWLSLPLLLGLLLPSSVLALALASSWNRPSTQWIYRSDVIVCLGLTARYLYLPLRLAKLGCDQLPSSWIDAARLTDSPPLLRWLLIELPLLAEAAVVTWIVAFLLAFRDLETTILFYPPGGGSLPLRIMTLEANSPPGATASAAALQIGVTALLVAGLGMALWVGRWRRRT